MELKRKIIAGTVGLAGILNSIGCEVTPMTSEEKYQRDSNLVLFGMGGALMKDGYDNGKPESADIGSSMVNSSLQRPDHTNINLNFGNQDKSNQILMFESFVSPYMNKNKDLVFDKDEYEYVKLKEFNLNDSMVFIFQSSNYEGSRLKFRLLNENDNIILEDNSVIMNEYNERFVPTRIDKSGFYTGEWYLDNILMEKDIIRVR